MSLMGRKTYNQLPDNLKSETLQLKGQQTNQSHSIPLIEKREKTTHALPIEDLLHSLSFISQILQLTG